MLERDTLQPERYRYLTKAQSTIYDKAKAEEYNKEQACELIVWLLEEIAAHSERAHRMSSY